MMNLDEKNCLILNLLQEDCRISLTDIGKRVGLSVDSVTKRIKRMIREDVFFPKIQLRPRNFGFNNIVDVKIKLHNYEEKDIDSFVKYLKDNPYVAEIFSLSGAWNFSIVIISRDFKDLAKISKDIQSKFGKIIYEWSESLTTCVYKFEKYDMLKLIECEKKRETNVQK